MVRLVCGMVIGPAAEPPQPCKPSSQRQGSHARGQLGVSRCCIGVRPVGPSRSLGNAGSSFVLGIARRIRDRSVAERPEPGRLLVTTIFARRHAQLVGIHAGR